MNIKTTVLFVLLAMAFSKVATAQTKNCGSAQIVAGNNCERLFVKFDLNGCSETQTVSQLSMSCTKDEGEAKIDTAGFTYSVKVKTGANGWEISGPVSERIKGKEPKGKKTTNVLAVPAPSTENTSPTNTPKPKPIVKSDAAPAIAAVTAHAATPVPAAAPATPPAAPPASHAAATPAVAAAPVPTTPPVQAPAVSPAASAPAVAAAAPKSNLVVKGNIRTRWQMDERTTDLSTISNYVLLRGRVDIGYTVSPSLYVFAQPQFAKAMGEPRYVSYGTAANTRTDTSGGT